MNDQPVMQQAVAVFGPERANGVFTELLKRFGPILAELLLKFILQQQLSGTLSSPVPEGGSGPIVIGPWVASILESHREEVLDLIRASAGDLFDAGIAALRGA